MEIKKTSKADLEGGKTLSLLMGIVLGLAILFVGFEWGTSELQISESERITDIIAEEEIEMTRQEDELPPPPPPPPPQQEVVAEVLSIVEDNVDVGEQILMSTEDTQREAQILTYVAPTIAVVEEVEEASADQIFSLAGVEKWPEFPGGEAALLAFLASRSEYPPVAAENGIAGRVQCSFVVNTDGSVVDIEVIRSVEPSLDREAVRVLRLMPRWTPGEQGGKPVRVRYSVPVLFRIDQR